MTETQREFLADLGLIAPRILDLGAHIGEFAVTARSLWPNCWISCVEPSEDCLEYLQERADEVKNALLSDEDGQTLTFWRRRIDAYGGSSGNSVFRETTAFFDDDQVRAGLVWSEPKRTTTVDALYAGAPAFDIAKLDLQGSEKRAILGGIKTLSRCDLILCEQQRGPYNAGAPLAGEVDEAIRRMGRDPFDDAGMPDTFRLFWESDHEIVGRTQVERMYVRVGCALDRKMTEFEPSRARPRVDYDQAAEDRYWLD